MRRGLLHAGVGVEDDLAGRGVDQPDRQRLDQLAAAGLGQHPAMQPALEQVQFCLLCRPVDMPLEQAQRRLSAETGAEVIGIITRF